MARSGFRDVAVKVLPFARRPTPIACAASSFEQEARTAGAPAALPEQTCEVQVCLLAPQRPCSFDPGAPAVTGQSVRGQLP